jgi:hypothetical protein
MSDRIAEGMKRSSSRSRGRIANVLADARASLLEPSRPYTPASLDSRTSIDVRSLDKYGKTAMSKNASFGRIPGDYESGLTGPPSRSDAQDLRKSLAPNWDTSSRLSSSNPWGARQSAAGGDTNDILMAVYRIKVAVSSDDVSEESDADGDLKLTNVVSLREICLQAYEAVDKLSKYLRSDGARTNPEGELIVKMKPYIALCCLSSEGYTSTYVDSAVVVVLTVALYSVEFKP